MGGRTGQMVEGPKRFSIISVLFVLVEALDCDVAVTCVSA